MLLSLLLPAALAGETTFTPMPVGGVSTDFGLGYGAYGLLVRQGETEQDLYRLRVGLQFFFSTGDYQDHWLKLDAPGVFGSPWRVDLLAGWEAWQRAAYFGHGGVGTRFRPERTRALRYDYDIRGGKLLTNLRRQLGGDWSAFGTGFVRLARVTPYPGSQLDRDQPSGIEGGLYTRFALGVMFDSRDTLPKTTQGVFSELSVRASHPWLGSDWRALGVNLTDRRYWDLRGDGRLVLTNRGILDLRFGDEPFFMSQVLGSSSWVELGGPWALRGYAQGRFRGDAALLLSPELRWTVHTLHIRQHALDLIPTPFVDIARVWSWDEPDLPEQWKAAVGLGARFAWNDDMVLRADMALGLERYEDGGQGLVPGVYFMFDHPY